MLSCKLFFSDKDVLTFGVGGGCCFTLQRDFQQQSDNLQIITSKRRWEQVVHTVVISLVMVVPKDKSKIVPSSSALCNHRKK